MIGLLKLIFLGIAAIAIIGRLVWRACEPGPHERAERLARISERLMAEDHPTAVPRKDTPA